MPYALNILQSYSPSLTSAPYVAYAKLKHSMNKAKSRGFTIVELLIVIIIIAILAAITIVAYTGIQQRARDSQRKTHVQAIVKALELYYIDNGRYPSGSGSTTINNAWSTTADASWSNLATALSPYLATLPADPISTPNANPQFSVGYNYAYFAGNYCGTTNNQVFILVYRNETVPQENTLTGTCTAPLLGPYNGANSSNTRVSK